MIDFLHHTVNRVFTDLALAFKHAVNLVIIDGLCLGIDVSGDRQKVEILQLCNDYLKYLDTHLFRLPAPALIDYERLPYIESATHIGVEPFKLSKIEEV